jgi:2-keto-4-pentenoate hydratase/2-oxohepta-3-ene-1,7-dioic acid hydratase in catechol pathway
MRFVSFSYRGGLHVGVIDADAADGDDRILHLGSPQAAARLGSVPGDMVGLLRAGVADWARHIASETFADAAYLKLRDVELLPAVTAPGKIIGAAFNYRDNLRESGRAEPSEPVLFAKFATTLVAHGAIVAIPSLTANVTYEAELAVVIGRRAHRVSAAQARDYVGGYTIMNDVSATDLVRRDGNFFRGKNLDTFGPLGPFLATADEIGDPHALRISLEVDGRVLQDSSTSQLLFGVDHLISYISQAMTLEPGDVIATGTPAGVAAAHDPPAFLRPGSTVSISVEGLGTLRNSIEAAA